MLKWSKISLLLSQNLSFDDHISQKIETANKAFGMIKYILYHNALSDKSKTLFYKQLISPILTYGFPIWYKISNKTIKQLAVFERKCLRSIFRLGYYQQLKKTHNSTSNIHLSNTYLYEKANINTIVFQLFKNSNNFIARLDLESVALKNLQSVAESPDEIAHFNNLTPMALAHEFYNQNMISRFYKYS